MSNDKEKELLNCLKKINDLRIQEKEILDRMYSILSCHPITIVDDEITRLLGAPTSNCGNCRHWDNNICDILEFGCLYEK